MKNRISEASINCFQALDAIGIKGDVKEIYTTFVTILAFLEEEHNRNYGCINGLAIIRDMGELKFFVQASFDSPKLIPFYASNSIPFYTGSVQAVA